MTEDELMRLPKDGRKWELVDGRLTEVPTELGDTMIFGVIIDRLVDGTLTRGKGSVTTGQAGFRMTNRNLSAHPDVSFTRRKERIPGGGAAPRGVR